MSEVQNNIFQNSSITRGPWATSLTWGRLLNVFNIILQISNYLPFFMGIALYLKKKIWISSTQGCFMPSLVETGRVVLKKKIFKYSPYFAIISLREGCGPFFVKIWIPSTQGCFVPNLAEISPEDFKRGFWNNFNIILLFRFYLPFEKGVALHLNKIESPPLKDVLCQVWLKLT